LTGLFNRRHLDASIHRFLAARRRLSPKARVPATVILFDLDNFGAFNKRHGHRVGDTVLRGFGELLLERFRASDLVARYGGEEFAVLLPICHLDEAMEVIERLRAATPEGQTVSAGVAEWNGYEGEEALIDRADLALYNAKRAGRDRTTAAA
jgi:diguanylate cyclase (GGDEF)-like protein